VSIILPRWLPYAFQVTATHSLYVCAPDIAWYADTRFYSFLDPDLLKTQMSTIASACHCTIFTMLNYLLVKPMHYQSHNFTNTFTNPIAKGYTRLKKRAHIALIYYLLFEGEQRESHITNWPKDTDKEETTITVTMSVESSVLSN
jgi:hypothetical protein